MQALSLGLVALTCATTALCAAGAQRRALEGGSRRHYHRVQHGHCSYTFVLPEADPPPCPAAPAAPSPANALLQRDSPAGTVHTGHGATQRLRHLERILENSTQWLLKLESYIQMSMKPEMAQLRQTAVQNQTATMLEIGSTLLNQSAEQSRKLTSVEAQVLNQTSRIEMQLQENSLSTTKLEKQLLLQTNEIHKLQNRNNILEVRVLEMETKHQAELAGARSEKEKLQHLVSRQSGTIEELEKSLLAASTNTSLLQRQQLQLLETVQSLVRLVSQGRAPLPGQQQLFQDCAEVRRAGIHASGVYTLHITNLSEPKKAYCDMEMDRGGWTVIQLRANGSLSFQRSWKEYKQGFGDAAGEYWMGNEAVHLLTSQAPYALRIELQDWEGGQVYAHYGKFQLGSEQQLYRLSLQDYSGTAGQQSGMALQGTRFSTRDADNDNCLCKCAQMLSGGWWFDACGLSNLNGIYYPARHNIRKLNGIRWHHFQGPSYSLKGTRMLIRPTSF
ncbi:angiopoietin-4 [Falco biarmicus]|uniref:Angiopoietin 4 n=1 Tax=Falco tinnunculus TaxID=100819 RepID=A0A8C4TVB8_FALTI|nr:angiopoietin-4 [Falco rusticolus]XP_040465410.1 angiopoietin-4 isoform X1 [Falco naumanni]XP_055578993.1 angiopoietin-4 [Falco cherrug]XP_056211062.1 angiopoietin-4 [Falco biarmicus]